MDNNIDIINKLIFGKFKLIKKNIRNYIVILKA